MWQQASTQSNKLKPKVANTQAVADNKAKEVKDNAAENAVNAVTKTVTPIVASPP